MDFVEILYQFQPVRESIEYFAGGEWGITSLRASCRAMHVLFRAPLRVKDVDEYYSRAVLANNPYAILDALARGAKDHVSALFYASSGGEKFSNIRKYLFTVASSAISLASPRDLPMAFDWRANDVILAGAAMGGHEKLCEQALRAGSKKYDAMLYYASAGGHREIAILAIGLGAALPCMTKGAAHGHKASLLAEGIAREETYSHEFICESRLYQYQPTTSRAIVDEIFSKHVHCCDVSSEACRAFMETLNVIVHDDHSICQKHLALFANPRSQCCAETYRLACMHGCDCAKCNSDCFASRANCVEIWKIAYEYKKVNANFIACMGAKRGSVEVCEFAHSIGASCAEEMLALGALNGHISICRLAREMGARDFMQMFVLAYRNEMRFFEKYRVDMDENIYVGVCRLALEWSRTLSPDERLAMWSRIGDVAKCREAIADGARNITISIEISFTYGHSDVAAAIMRDFADDENYQ